MCGRRYYAEFLRVFPIWSWIMYDKKGYPCNFYWFITSILLLTSIYTKLCIVRQPPCWYFLFLVYIVQCHSIFTCIYTVRFFLTVIKSCPTTYSFNLRGCQFVSNNIKVPSFSILKFDTRTYYARYKIITKARWLVYTRSWAAWWCAASTEKYFSVVLFFFHRTGRMPHYTSFVGWITIELDNWAHAIITLFKLEIFLFVWML